MAQNWLRRWLRWATAYGSSLLAATALLPGLSRKLKKVLETWTDSPDLLVSLATLCAFYFDNTPQVRRKLKSSIEQRALAINQHFFRASFAAQQALDRVEEEVNALADCCNQKEFYREWASKTNQIILAPCILCSINSDMRACAVNS